jgi:mannose-1-phosphate guanylyltransferase/mannose-6-phosphate isomerase
VEPTALVLAGGSGTRFWPASRRSRPKQLLALDAERSLLAQTVARLAPLVAAPDVWVATTAALAPAVAEELERVPAGQILGEPAGRNTAPAIAWALLSMPEAARRGIVVVLPSDHRVADPEGFRRTLARAIEVAAESDRIVTLGVVPRWAETGFGYLELADPPEAGSGAPRAVARFREKPDRATATAFVASGRHLWNAGIFVFRGTRLLEAIELHAPGLAAGLAALDAEPARAAELYAALPSISIDYAVMEKLDDLLALPLDCGWDDLGSWQALFEVLPAGAGGNRLHGDAVALDTENSLLFADHGLIATLGVRDLVVVRTGDAVLVAHRDRAQEVRRVVERLEAAGRRDLL